MNMRIRTDIRGPYNHNIDNDINIASLTQSCVYPDEIRTLLITKRFAKSRVKPKTLLTELPNF